jgi:hypothetical protein
MKAAVYSWRVSTDMKSELEREARRRKTSIGGILDLAAREWLNKSGAENESDEEQMRLQAAASKCFGAFAGSDPGRSKNVRQEVRRRLRLRQRNGR